MDLLQKTIHFQGTTGGPTFSRGGPAFKGEAQLFPGVYKC